MLPHEIQYLFDSLSFFVIKPAGSCCLVLGIAGFEDRAVFKELAVGENSVNDDVSIGNGADQPFGDSYSIMRQLPYPNKVKSCCGYGL